MTDIQDKRNPGKRGTHHIWQNPLLIKEIRGRMRGGRAFILLTSYLGFLALVILLVYFIYASTGSNLLIANQRQVFSKTLFWIVYGVQLITISFVGPALTGGSISGERERQTYDLLRTSLLPAGNLVIGKYLTGVIFLLLLSFSALPIQSLSFFLGGVSAQEVFLGSFMLFVIIMVVSAVGMVFSSFTSRSLLSIVLSYGFTIFNIFGLPLFLFLLFVVFQSNSLSYLENLSITGQTLLLSFGWVLVSLNPVATTIASEAILIERQSLIAFAIPLRSGAALNLISPWIPFSIFYMLLSGVLLWISVRRVRQPEI